MILSVALLMLGSCYAEYDDRPSYQDGYDAGRDDGYSEGYSEGKSEGYEEGYERGVENTTDGTNGDYDAGFYDGYDYGHDTGYDSAYERGYDEATREIIVITLYNAGYKQAESDYKNGRRRKELSNDDDKKFAYDSAVVLFTYERTPDILNENYLDVSCYFDGYNDFWRYDAY
jgi:hypothetical protein